MERNRAGMVENRGVLHANREGLANREIGFGVVPGGSQRPGAPRIATVEFL